VRLTQPQMRKGGISAMIDRSVDINPSVLVPARVCRSRNRVATAAYKIKDETHVDICPTLKDSKLPEPGMPYRHPRFAPFNELMQRPQSDRLVTDHGPWVSAELPDCC
jgi:hypothetical protein